MRERWQPLRWVPLFALLLVCLCLGPAATSLGDSPGHGPGPGHGAGFPQAAPPPHGDGAGLPQGAPPNPGAPQSDPAAAAGPQSDQNGSPGLVSPPPGAPPGHNFDAGPQPDQGQLQDRPGFQGPGPDGPPPAAHVGASAQNQGQGQGDGHGQFGGDGSGSGNSQGNGNGTGQPSTPGSIAAPAPAPAQSTSPGNGHGNSQGDTTSQSQGAAPSQSTTASRIGVQSVAANGHPSGNGNGNTSSSSVPGVTSGTPAGSSTPTTPATPSTTPPTTPAGPAPSGSQPAGNGGKTSGLGPTVLSQSGSPHSHSGGSTSGGAPSTATFPAGTTAAAAAASGAGATRFLPPIAPVPAPRVLTPAAQHSAHHAPVTKPHAAFTGHPNAIASIGNLLPVPLPVPDWSKPIISLLALFCIILALRAFLSSRRAGKLESQRRRLAADLESLQPALVPEIPSTIGPLAVSVAYRPADGPAAGGDFYDVFPVGKGRVAALVGDVSGHGRDALTRAAHMRYMLRAYVETGLDPRSALKLAGRVLGADSEALFTTVAVAVYDAETATLTYATAGHPAPVLLGPGAHEPLTGCASPALGWGAPTGRRQTTVPFSEGARACFFSDGVTELRTANGLLGRTRLTKLAAKTDVKDAAPKLLEQVQREARSIRDDMAACVIQAMTGAAVSEHRIDELEVEPRHLESGQGERFLKISGVSGGDSQLVLARAAEIAAESGSALLRVEVAGQTSTATAVEPGPVGLAIPASLDPEAQPAPARTRAREASTGQTLALG